LRYFNNPNVSQESIKKKIVFGIRKLYSELEKGKYKEIKKASALLIPELSQIGEKLGQIENSGNAGLFLI